MNPRRDFTEMDSHTVRAYIQFQIDMGDVLKIDHSMEVSDDEVRSYLFEDEQTKIGFNGVNNPYIICNIKEYFENMTGASISEYSSEVEEDPEIGEYEASLLSVVIEDVESEWNKPCLIVYGSLRPEIKKACHIAFEDNCDFYNVRNHYIIRGRNVTDDDRTELATALQSLRMFENERRDYISDIRTSDFA